MKKAWTRNLYLIGLVVGILLGVPLIVFQVMSGTINANPMYVSNLVGVGILVGASLCILTAWIGALVKTISLRRWGWFASLLVFSGPTLCAYGFVAPEAPSFSEKA